jgi:hypothetical protein
MGLPQVHLELFFKFSLTCKVQTTASARPNILTERGMRVVSFTGSQYLTLGNPPALNLLPSSPYTVTAVVKYTGSTYAASIISRCIDTTRQYMFYTFNGGALCYVGGILGRGGSIHSLLSLIPLTKLQLVSTIDMP